MDHVFTYLMCFCFMLLTAALVYLSYRSLDGDKYTGVKAHCLGVFSGMLFLASASPLVYEFPDPLFNDSTVIEVTTDGRITEHPYGAFGLEGRSALINVPASDKRIGVYTGVQSCSPGSEPKTLYHSGGYATVTDYALFMKAIKPEILGEESATLSEDAARSLVKHSFEKVVDSHPELKLLCNAGSAQQQDYFRRVVDEKVNILLAERGLAFHTSKFWL